MCIYKYICYSSAGDCGQKGNISADVNTFKSLLLLLLLLVVVVFKVHVYSKINFKKQ